MSGAGDRPDAGDGAAGPEEALAAVARLWADAGDEAAVDEAVRIAAAAGDEEPGRLVHDLRARREEAPREGPGEGAG